MTSPSKKYQTMTDRAIKIAIADTIQIRSKHFTKNRIPLIGKRQIPMHNAFGITISDVNKATTLREPVMWGCIVKQKRRRYHDKQENQEKQTINRPVEMLKKYLFRKERRSFGPQLSTKHQQPDEFQKYQSKTISDFHPRYARVKLPSTAPQKQNNEPDFYLSGVDFDAAIIKGNNNKNLYKMTHEELEQSINWKKKFLAILTQKIRETKTVYQ